ncbi:MAG TPA: DUF4375 domain-containing protein [Pirellulales bacterium]
MIDPQAVVVAKSAFESDDVYAIVGSNVDVVNALQEEYLTLLEISPDAVRSYYADYLVAELANGGFSQFVYNSCWDHDVIRWTREGLTAMGATQHLALLARGEEMLEGLGPEGRESFYESEYFGENQERDYLSALDEEFAATGEAEDVIALNAAWLRSLPNLVVLTDEEIIAMVEARGAALPDREARIAEAEANEPRYLTLIRALCEKAGHELEDITAADNNGFFEGEQTFAWHFITDKGHHHMVDVNGVGVMFVGDTQEEVCRVEMPDDEDDEDDEDENDE